MTNEQIKARLQDMLDEAIRHGTHKDDSLLQRIRELIADIEEGA